jgi:hypothetical protein
VEGVECGVVFPHAIERPPAEIGLESSVQTPASGMLAEPSEVTADVQCPPKTQPLDAPDEAPRGREGPPAVLEEMNRSDHPPPRLYFIMK